MKTKSTFAIAAIAAITVCSYQKTNAQNEAANRPHHWKHFWSLNGNNNATNNSKLGTRNAVNLRLVTNNIERMRITSMGDVYIYKKLHVLGTSTFSGNVGIGTTANAYRLNIGGDVNIKGDVYLNSKCFISAKGEGNTFLGISAGRINKGDSNTAMGQGAMFSNTTGMLNTATGFQALYSNTEGGSNNAYGHQALYSNNGFGNDAFGRAALYYNTTGFFNVASGLAALVNNTEGFSNVASGAFALVQNATGIFNVAIGVGAIEGNTTNSFNTAIGGEAGGLSLNFSNATFLGAQTNTDSGVTNITAVGYQAQTKKSNQVVVGNTAVTSIGGYANWSNFSDGRYKKNIKDDVPGLEFISQLRPVTYTLNVNDIESANTSTAKTSSFSSIPAFNGHIPPSASNLLKAGKQPSSEELKAKQEKARVVYTGFIAQEVEQAAKKLNYDFSGVDAPKNEKGFYALRYSEFVVPLVKAVQEQQKQIEEQQRQIDELKALVKTITKQGNNNANLLSSGAYLKQNIPNPSTGNTLISYYIPEDGTNYNAQIKITDMKGRLLKIYTAQKGEGQINIGSAGLPSGTYNYSLMVNSKMIDTKQMIIRK